MNSIEEAPVILVLRVDDSLCVLYPLRQREPTATRSHLLCCIDVDPELYDVVEDMCTVSVVVLIKALPHSTAEMSDPMSSLSFSEG